MKTTPTIHTIDLNFQNCPQAIACYLIPYPEGLVLIESGPGSTQTQLTKSLSQLGYRLEQITHVLLTHIHLDHAGAAGWLAEQSGAQIFVHPRGAPHLIDPSRLLASAARIYGDQMEPLWGDFQSVPENQLIALEDGQEIKAGSLIFRALDTPGHANHHLAYFIDEICFSGDVGGVRIHGQGPKHLRAPMPPPEFHPPRWRESLSRLKKEPISQIAPTHFGIFQDVKWHLNEVLSELDAVEAWMKQVMPRGLELEEVRKEFLSWVRSRAAELGLDHQIQNAFEKANPSGMSADGIYRYWNKYIQPS